MNATQNTNFANVVIPRVLPDDGKVAIFFADEIPTGDTYTAYVEGEGVKEIPKEVYAHSDRLNVDDIKVALELYRRAAGVESPIARERMPYKKKTTAQIPRRLVNVDENTGKVEVDQSVADNTEDKETRDVIQHIIDKTAADKPAEEQPKQKRKYEKRSQYWAMGAPKKRKSAKRSEAQKARVEAEIAATTVEQGKDDSFRRQVESQINSTESTPAVTLDAATIERVTALATKVAMEAMLAELKKAA